MNIPVSLYSLAKPVIPRPVRLALRRTRATVLTHDVEGIKGLKACSALARLEETLGFRSSFNVVPEGEYAVPCALGADRAACGFEVGVHDLHQDRNLYRSVRNEALLRTQVEELL